MDKVQKNSSNENFLNLTSLNIYIYSNQINLVFSIFDSKNNIWECISLKPSKKYKNIFFVSISKLLPIKIKLIRDSEIKEEETFIIEDFKDCFIFEKNEIIQIESCSLKIENLIFFTDLDDTLIKEIKNSSDNYEEYILRAKKADFSLKNFYVKWMKTVGFLPNCHLIYTPGRNFQNYIKTKLGTSFIFAEIIVCSNGSEIYILNPETNEYEKNENWDKHTTQYWDSKKLLEEFNKLDYLTPNWFTPHDEISLRYICNTEIYRKNYKNIIEIKNRLKSQGYEFIDYVSGFEEPRFIDIHSKNAGKMKANRYLIEKFAFNEKECFCFGDSLNDLEMLKDMPNSVLVSNSVPELIEEFNKVKDSMKNMSLSNNEFADALTETLQNLLN